MDFLWVLVREKKATGWGSGFGFLFSFVVRRNKKSSWVCSCFGFLWLVLNPRTKGFSGWWFADWIWLLVGMWGLVVVEFRWLVLVSLLELVVVGGLVCCKKEQK